MFQDIPCVWAFSISFCACNQGNYPSFKTYEGRGVGGGGHFSFNPDCNEISIVSTLISWDSICIFVPCYVLQICCGHKVYICIHPREWWCLQFFSPNPLFVLIAIYANIVKPNCSGKEQHCKKNLSGSSNCHQSVQAKYSILFIEMLTHIFINFNPQIWLDFFSIKVNCFFPSISAAMQLKAMQGMQELTLFYLGVVALQVIL